MNSRKHSQKQLSANVFGWVLILFLTVLTSLLPTPVSVFAEGGNGTVIPPESGDTLGDTTTIMTSPLPGEEDGGIYEMSTFDLIILSLDLLI